MKRFFTATALLLILLFSAVIPLSAEELTLKIPRGSNLSFVLRDAGIPSGEISPVLKALSSHINLRKIRPSQEIKIILDKEAAPGEPALKQLTMETAYDEKVIVRHNGWGFDAQLEKSELILVPRKAEGKIENSFYSDMAAKGVPGSKIMELFRHFSFDVDFQRDIREGDTFRILYLDFVDENDEIVKHGPIVFAELVTRGTPLSLYGFVTDEHYYDFYNENGKSMRKTLLKTPVTNATISSTYGMRKNPIYGYENFHKGLDFAAPKNTPIIAAGSGIVERASWFDIYGNCVILRHTNGYKTLYAHMNSYGKGIKKGVRVSQGQVIGYVGSTGMSTGPHLHYEVHFNGKKINPASVKSPPERNLSEKELERFKKRKQEIDDLFATLKNSE